MDVDCGRDAPLRAADALRLRRRRRLPHSGHCTVVALCYRGAVPESPGRKNYVKRLVFTAAVAAVLVGVIPMFGSAASFVDSKPCPAQGPLLVCPAGQVGQ